MSTTVEGMSISITSSSLLNRLVQVITNVCRTHFLWKVLYLIKLGTLWPQSRGPHQWVKITKQDGALYTYVQTGQETGDWAGQKGGGGKCVDWWVWEWITILVKQTNSLTWGSRMGEVRKWKQEWKKCHLVEFWWRIRGLYTRACISVHKAVLGSVVPHFQWASHPRAALQQMQHSNIVAQAHRKHSTLTADIVINIVTKHTQYKTHNHIWQHIRGYIAALYKHIPYGHTEEMTDWVTYYCSTQN